MFVVLAAYMLWPHFMITIFTLAAKACDTEPQYSVRAGIFGSETYGVKIHLQPSKRQRPTTARPLYFRIPEAGFSIALIVALTGPPVTNEVEKNRRGKAYRVQPVEHAAVPGDACAPVLYAAVTLDRRHHQPAEKAHHRNDK